ncbi:Hint domain-containing protein [Acetobacter oryzoeni]|uniref:Hedgehog/Intein (Hint) domain-containing protein n=1 Tax=Acetobacter oryzoeni TaxID=2500548 RepID=A0A5B9GLH1_9PROT|nr:Hint domain-containing protein [Acetobacter oryzoeni]MCP1203676.1 Hint domain-containing protein [Acetobacter oryzoeni]QEE86933.1 hypothetical protein EOV40_014630 [Acetobacter oryzoeni]
MTDITSDTTIGGNSSNATELNGGTVVSGARLFVSSGGTATHVSATINGYINVCDGGNAVSSYLSGSDPTTSAAATLNVSSGGNASFTSAVSGANIIVYSDGTTDHDIAGAGGQETVSGTATNLTVNNGHAYLSKGGSGANWTAENGGWIGVYDGGTLTSVTVTDANTYVDVQGGQVTNATVTSSGILQIENGVTVSVISATSGGSIQVSSGGTATDATIGTGGVLDVANGGSSISATLSESDATFSLSGSASDTTVSAGAVNVYKGGVLTSTTVQSGIVTLSGGSASHVSATNGSGGIIVGGTDSSGNVISGSLTSATLASGGYVHISAGGTATSDVVSSGGTEYVDKGGNSISAQIVTSNANIIVSAGGSATDATIVSGYATVYDSGTMVGGSIQSGIITVSGGVVSNVTADNGGGFDVSGGSVSGLQLNTGGFVNLYDGGSATDITGSGSNLSSGGNGGINISGGTLTSASFQDGSTLSATGGTITSATFNSNGYGFASNASLTDTHINPNGNLVVYAGATTTNTVVDGTGAEENSTFEAISAGGSSINATIENGGYQYANASATIINPTAKNGGNIIIHSQGILSGATISQGGSLSIESGGQLNGTVTLQDGGKATIYPDGGGVINLGGDDNTGLVISGLTSDPTSDVVVSTEIDDFTGSTAGSSDGIELAGLKASDVTAVTVNTDDAVLTLTNGKTVTLNIKGAGSVGYNISESAEDGSLIYEVCFLSGSMIRTSEGDVAVEDIQIGDQVVAFDWKNNKDITRPVVWVGKAHANVRPGLPDDEAGYPVRVLKDAISDGVPYKDMLITSEHCLFFEGRFVPVRMLVNGTSIFYDKSITSYDYYHVETDQHSVITADGMLTESYLDTGNRHAFRQKGKIAALRIHTKSWEDNAGAPLCVERSFVESLFHKLKVRENTVLGCAVPTEQAELTEDPNLHLVTQAGAVIRPVRQEDQRYSFMLPANTQSVRIVSHASRPADVIGPFVDDRRQMGVAVADVYFITAKKLHPVTTHLQADKPEGWYDTDWTDCAWTNGNAVLPLGDFTKGNMGLLSMTIRAKGPYLRNTQLKSNTKKQSA